MTCRDLKACPVCASVVSERRRKELQRLDQAARSRKLRVLLVSLTFAHSRQDDLGQIVDLLLRAVRRFWGGRAGQDFRQRWQIQGHVRGLEVTWGAYAGWHPHCHLLVYLPEEVGELEQFGAEFLSRWLAALRSVGLDGNEKACDVQDTNGRIAEYLAKFDRTPRWDEASEVARANVKHGRGQHFSPFDLLARAGGGDDRAGRLFVEYVRCLRGRRLVQASPGLASWIGREDLATDDELYDDSEAHAWLLALIRRGGYGRVVAQDAVPELLQAGASGDFGEVAALCDALGLSEGEYFAPIPPEGGNNGLL